MSETPKKVLGSVRIPADIIADVKKQAGDILGFEKKITEYATQNTTNLLDVILYGAINLSASDIHLEPQKDAIRLRVRIDGVLQDAASFQAAVYQSLLSRLKLLSKLKLNITDKPQDGRFTVAVEDLLIEIRTSSLPAEYGESIVMRILNPQNFMALETLNLRQDIYQTLETQLQKPNGMIIVTGPTGSGKTTTLYAFLMKLQNPEIKIITIEDPIEYHLKGVSQTQVSEGESHIAQATGQLVTKKGYDFSEGLKSIVRQDPDVILVGEIRDLETAKIALQASLTGHLVLTTLHTNDAAGTIPRLVDLGAEPSSIAPALNMSIAQRLVRKVCPACSALVKPTKEELAQIKKGLAHLPKNIALPKIGATLKIAKTKEKGCKECNFTGYKGRKGLYEIFVKDDQMEKYILTNPAVSEIRAMLIKKGMVTMYQSGLIEVLLGQTTLEEVKRVVEEE